MSVGAGFQGERAVLAKSSRYKQEQGAEWPRHWMDRNEGRLGTVGRGGDLGQMHSLRERSDRIHGLREGGRADSWFLS